MKERCLRLLREVRETAASPGEAYVLRSRLGRLLLDCLRLAARSSGAREPAFPHRFELSRDAPLPAVELMAECNRVMDVSTSLVQASEPLDERWRAGWSRLETALADLEARLQRHDWPG